MKTLHILTAGLMCGAVAVTPGMAQMSRSADAAMSGMTSPPTASGHATPNIPLVKMTSMETKKMKACMKMTSKAMMADAKCVRLKSMHDDMVKNKGM